MPESVLSLVPCTANCDIFTALAVSQEVQDRLQAPTFAAVPAETEELFPLHWCWPTTIIIIIIIIIIMAGVGANSRASPRNVGGTWGIGSIPLGDEHPELPALLWWLHLRVPGWNEKHSLARNAARENYINDTNDDNSMELGVPNYITTTYHN